MMNLGASHSPQLILVSMLMATSTSKYFLKYSLWSTVMGKARAW